MTNTDFDFNNITNENDAEKYLSIKYNGHMGYDRIEFEMIKLNTMMQEIEKLKKPNIFEINSLIGMSIISKFLFKKLNIVYTSAIYADSDEEVVSEMSINDLQKIV